MDLRISPERYNELRNAEEELLAMNSFGVDNWVGYDEVEWPDGGKDYSSELRPVAIITNGD